MPDLGDPKKHTHAKAATEKAPPKMSYALSLAQKLVRCPSITPSPGKTFGLLSKALEDLGFYVLIQNAEGVSNLYATKAFPSLPSPTSGEPGHLKQTPEPHLLFLGHVDVVPPGPLNAWTHPPFSGHLDPTHLWGRGTADMKGAIAAFIAAIQETSALHLASDAGKSTDQKTAPSGTRISLLLTSDEEGPAVWGTCHAIAWLQEKKIWAPHAPAATSPKDAAQTSQGLAPLSTVVFGAHTPADLALFQSTPPTFCLVGEPSSDKIVGDALKCGRRGSLTGSFTLYGKSGHSAYPEKHLNPLPVLFNTLLAFEQKALNLAEKNAAHRPPPFPPRKDWQGGNPQKTAHPHAEKASQLLWGLLDKGDAFFEPSRLTLTGLHCPQEASNVTPTKATAFFSIRFNTHHSGPHLEKLLKSLLSETGLVFDLDLRIHGEPYLTQDKKLLDGMRNAVETVTQKAPLFSTKGGTSDGRFLSAICPVIELGLESATIHQINERIKRSSLEKLAKIYAAVLDNFLAP